MPETPQVEEMKRYLFREMSDEESSVIEERIFADSDFFYELTNLENDLVDRYVCKKLKDKELARFEQSLSKIPERLSKIANAIALQAIIKEEKSKSIAAVPNPGLWEQIAGFFNLRVSGFQFIAGVVVILLGCVTVFLLYQNWQLQDQNQSSQDELARLERRHEAELSEKKKLLQQEEEKQRRQNEANNQQRDALQDNGNRQIEDKKSNNKIEKLKRETEDLERKTIPSSKRINEKTHFVDLAVNVFRVNKGKTNGSLPTAVIRQINGKQKMILSVPVPTNNGYASIDVVTKSRIYHRVVAKGKKSVVFYLPPNDETIHIRAKKHNASGDSESLGEFELIIPQNKK